MGVDELNQQSRMRKDCEVRADVMSRCQSAAIGHSFLDAWKEGVALYPDFFHIRVESIREATARWELEPKSDEYWADNGAALNRLERTFLAAMLSFYDAERGYELLEAMGFGSIADLASVLDTRRCRVIGTLFVTHKDW